MASGPSILLDRATVLDALTELVAALRDRGVAATIQIVGGAAINLGYDLGRPPTVDVDAFVAPAGEILEVVAAVAAGRGWRTDWLNDKALAFASHHDVPQDWTVVIEDGPVVVSIASAELLFAMKANACRGARDGRDLLVLADRCGITTIGDAEAVFDRYFPHDVFDQKGLRWLRAHFRGEDPFDV